jgi:ABC-type branched-subunit amino acid transport system permease subunit
MKTGRTNPCAARLEQFDPLWPLQSPGVVMCRTVELGGFDGRHNLQILNGLDKGSAYALIALGLTLIFGTLGVVNFAHGALFMIGAFCAVTLSRILTISSVRRSRPGPTFSAIR